MDGGPTIQIRPAAAMTCHHTLQCHNIPDRRKCFFADYPRIIAIINDINKKINIKRNGTSPVPQPFAIRLKSAHLTGHFYFGETGHYRWLDRAVNDLEEACEFILYDNPQAAASEVEAVLKAVERLAKYPAMGKVGRVPETREMAVADTPYLVIYRAKNGCLEILQIFHCARRLQAS